MHDADSVSSLCLQWLSIIYQWLCNLTKSTQALKHSAPEEPMLNVAEESMEMSECLPPTELTVACEVKVPEKPRSPCFVAELPEQGARLPIDPAALKACQLMVIDCYCKLVMNGVLQLGLGPIPLTLASGAPPLCHPIQDPSGSLFQALLIVRRQRPGSGILSGAPNARLCLTARRSLAAITIVCHKMNSNGIHVHYFMHNVHEQFFYKEERPKWESDWRRECCLFSQYENEVLGEPLLSLSTNTALSHAEEEIERLMQLEKLSMETAAVLRGSLFFLLGSCLLDPSLSYEDLVQTVGSCVVGEGCVSLLLTLLHTSCMRPGGRRLRDSEVLYRAPYGLQVDQVAQAILRAACAPTSDPLREGPYRAQLFNDEELHPVQQLLTPANLMRGRKVFKECM